VVHWLINDVIKRWLFNLRINSEQTLKVAE